MNKKVQDVEKPSSFVKLPSSANFVVFFCNSYLLKTAHQNILSHFQSLVMGWIEP